MLLAATTAPGCPKGRPSDAGRSSSASADESVYRGVEVELVSPQPGRPLPLGVIQASSHQLTMFRGSPERNLSGVGFVPRRPKLLWRFQTKTKLEGPYEERGDKKLGEESEWRGLGWTGQPCYMEGRIYYGSSDSYVYCQDARSGELHFYYGTHHCVKGSISIFDEFIYHGGRDNKIHCYGLDGGMYWETRTGNDMDSSPVVVDGRGFTGGEDGNIYSFDPLSGEILWATATAGSVESSPCVANGHVFAGSSRGRLYCCDAVTGEILWEFKTLGDTDSTPVWWDGRIYVACATGDAEESGHVWCIDEKTGEKIWHVPMSRGVWATVAVNPDKGRLYVGCANGYIYSLRMEDGSLIWKRDLYSRIWSSPVVVDGCVLAAVRDGRFWCLDEETSEPIWVFDDGFDFDATPCVADGMIFIGSQNGWVYGIGESEEGEEINGHWFTTEFPMKRRLDHNPDGIVTIDNPAPPPGTYTDTNAANRENYREPVYGREWVSGEE